MAPLLTTSPLKLLVPPKAHLKPPENGAPFPMHQDYHYFPYEKDSMLAIFIHLDDTDPENGGLAVFPGSHKLGLVFPTRVYPKPKTRFLANFCKTEKPVLMQS